MVPWRKVGLPDGSHLCSVHGCLSELQQLGFTDGVDARKQLLAVARSVGIPQWAKTVAGAKSVLPATDISFAETSVND